MGKRLDEIIKMSGLEKEDDIETRFDKIIKMAGVEKIEDNKNNYSMYTNNNKGVEIEPVSTVKNEEVDNTRKLAVGALAGINNKINLKNENKTTIKKEDNLLNKSVYVGKKTGMGLVSGIAGMAQAGLTDTANNLKKGSEKETGNIIADIGTSFMGAITGNPTLSMLTNAPKKLENSLKILSDNNKNPLEKIVALSLNAVSDSIEDIPAKQFFNSVTQAVGKTAPGSDKLVMNLNNAISKPIDEANQALNEEGSNYDKVTQLLGDVGQTVGNMTPSILTVMATRNPNAGLAVMGVSTKGQSTQEALNMGEDLEQAIKIGNTKAMIEVGTEMLTGGVNIFGKGALDDIVEKGIVDKVKNNVAKKLLKQGLDVSGEVLEETISDVLDTTIDKGTVNPEAQYTIKDWGNTAITTVLSTLVLNAITGGIYGGINKANDKKINNSEVGTFYTTKFNENGEIEGIQAIIGKEIVNPNKEVNINPVVVLNNETNGYNIIDKNTGILIDSTQYKTFGDAQTGFNNKMKSANENTINTINKKIYEVNSIINNKAEELKSYTESVLSAEEYSKQNNTFTYEETKNKLNTYIETANNSVITQNKGYTVEMQEGKNSALLRLKDSNNNIIKTEKIDNREYSEEEIRNIASRFNNAIQKSKASVVKNESNTNVRSMKTNKEVTLDSIKNKYKPSTDVLSVFENKDTISLNNIVIKENLRNQGIGTKFMNELIQYADSKGKIITLTPTSEYGTKNKLTNFYKSFGFVENKGKNKDFVISDTMYKRPTITKKVDRQQIIDKVKYNPDGKQIKDTHYVEFLADRYVDKKNISGVETDTQWTENLLAKSLEEAKQIVDENNENQVRNKQKKIIIDSVYNRISNREFSVNKTLLNNNEQKEDITLNVEISKKGLNETLNKGISVEKISVMPYLDKLIMTSQDGIIRNESKKRANVDEWYYLYNTAIIDNELYGVKIDIKKTPQGDKFYVHRVHLINKKGTSNQIPAFGNGTIKISKVPSINNSISQNSKTVKGTTVNNKDMQKNGNNAEHVRNKVIKYLQEIESNMTADEFIDKFKDMKITKAENLSGDKKKLYDLIMEVQDANNSVLKEEEGQYIDKVPKIEYNDKGIKISTKEFNNLKKAINTDNPNMPNGLNYKNHGDYFYIFNKNSFDNYKILGKIKIIDSEQIINQIMKEVENHDRTTSSVDRLFKRSQNEQTVYIADNINAKNSRTATNDGGLSSRTTQGDKQFSNRRATNIKESNRNNKLNVKNSNKGSFSNMNEEQESYRYAYNELKADKKDNGVKVVNNEVIYRKFKQDFIDKGYTNLNDAKIETREDLADMAQIFRNPKYETFRIIYMKGNTIVGHEAISSKIPNASRMLRTDQHGKVNYAKEYYKINDRMKRLNADGYYMVHNHPAGSAKASREDIVSTNVFRKNVKGFKGHLILNSGTYAWIYYNGLENNMDWENEVKIQDYKQDEIDKLMNNNPTIDNITLNDVYEITRLIDNVKNTENYSVMIYADSKLKTRMVQEVHNSFFNMQDKQILGYLRKQAINNGASKVFFATNNEETYQKSEKLTRSDILMDSVLYKWNTLNGFNVPIVESMRRNKQIEYKGNGLFKDEKGLRANETFDEVYEMVQKTTKQWGFKQAKNNTNDEVRHMKKSSNIEKSQNMEYNGRTYTKITEKEKAQVISEVTTWRINRQDGIGYIDLSRNGYYSYMYIKDNGNIKVLRKYIGNEQYKELVRRAIENETYRQSDGLDKYLKNVEDKIRNNRRNISRSPGRQASTETIRKNNRNEKQQGRINGTEYTERSSKIIKNSNRGSFSNEEIKQAKKTEKVEESKTNAERADAYIEQEIKKIEKTGKWDENIPVTRRTDIRKTIEDYLGLGIKRGRFRQRAYGIYKGNRDIIRTKEYKDIDTILHETGHALDIGKRIKVDKKSIADELLKAIKKYGGYETESRKIKLEEGFAEVIREYGIIPEQTKKEYPQTVAIIEEIRKADEAFDKFIGKVQKQIYNYIHQTPINRNLSNQSIGEQTDKQPLTKEWIKQEVMRNIWDKDYAVKAMVNELAKAGGKTTNQIKASENAYLLTRLSNGIGQKSTSMLSNGYIDENGNKLMPGLNQIGEILENDPKRFNDLRAYLVAQRDLEYKARTLKTGLRTTDSKAIVKKFKKDKEIKEAAKIVYDTLDGVLQYAVNNKLITKEIADSLRKSNAFYVPMQRVIEGQGNQVGRKGAVSEIIKKRTGSELDVKDVLENIIANSTNIIQQVENNNILKALYKQGEEIGKTGGIYDVISTPMIKAGTAKLSNWEKELQKQGVNTYELDLEKTIDIFVPNNKVDTINLITSFIDDNGKRVYLQFYDEIIFNSIMGMDKPFMSKVLKINSKLNLPLRIGATMGNLGFAIPNMISDTAQATIYSKAGFIPVVDNAIGVLDILSTDNKAVKWFMNKVAPNYVEKINKMYTIYQQTGAQSATRLSQYRKSTQEVMKDVYGTKKSENLGIKESFKPLKRLLDLLTYIPELSENSTRFRVFERNYNYFIKKGYSEADARTMAAIESRDATQDFSRTGNITREINQLIPFSAARVGSAYTFAEKVKANPKQVAMRTSILIVLAMAIKAIGYDDKEIEELIQRKKDDNFVFKLGNEIITIKKPQGILRSIINLAEYIQDLATGHIEEGKEAERLGEWLNNAIMDNMPADEVTGLVPNSVAPLIENAINKDFYYNTDIVKSYDLELPDSEQYYDYNSQLAIWLGKIFNYSPAKIDNLISGYFGGLGTGLTDKMDWVLGKIGIIPEKPEMGAEDSMVGRRFIVNVNSNSESINEIYNRKTELTKKKNGGTITDKETEELETITNTISNLSKLNKQIKEIKADLKLSGEEKGKQIKELQKQKTDTARKALGKDLIDNSNETKIENMKFYPSNDTLKNNGYVLTMNSDMKKEYKKYAEQEYNRLKKQGIYTEDKMIESAKKKAKTQMFQTYKNKLVKAETK